jgi:LIM domain
VRTPKAAGAAFSAAPRPAPKAVANGPVIQEDKDDDLDFDRSDDREEARLMRHISGASGGARAPQMQQSKRVAFKDPPPPQTAPASTPVVVAATSSPRAISAQAQTSQVPGTDDLEAMLADLDAAAGNMGIGAAMASQPPAARVDVAVSRSPAEQPAPIQLTPKPAPEPIQLTPKVEPAPQAAAPQKTDGGHPCAQCGQDISGDFRQVGDHQFHTACFQCVDCRVELGDGLSLFFFFSPPLPDLLVLTV